MTSLFRKQTGDTIVEVLIALAVVGFTIGSAYVVTNSSTSSERKAQERSDALSLVQTQIEALDSAKDARDLPMPASTSTPFCMIYQATPTASYVSTTTLSGPNTQFAGTGPNQTTLTGYAPDCSFSATGSSPNTTQPVYYVFISFNATTNIYTVNANWFPAGGGGVEDMLMYYKAE